MEELFSHYLASIIELLLTLLGKIFKWCNNNQGALTLIIFVCSIFLGWVSGIFAALRREPKLTIQLLPGPTFFSVISRDNNQSHRIVIALYTKITNTGYAPTDISTVSLGYKTVFNNSMFKRNKWNWIDQPTASIEDFRCDVGEKNLKYYPFLLQVSNVTKSSSPSYLLNGESTNGILYFEGPELNNQYKLLIHNGLTNIKIKFTDGYGKKYVKKLQVPYTELEYARKFNPSYGSTHSTLHEHDNVSDYH